MTTDDTRPRYAVGVIGHNVVIDCGTHDEAMAYVERWDAERAQDDATATPLDDWLARVNQARNDRDWKALNDLVLEGQPTLAATPDPRPLSAEEEARLRAMFADKPNHLDARLLATLDAERARHAALVAAAGWALQLIEALEWEDDEPPTEQIDALRAVLGEPER